MKDRGFHQEPTYHDHKEASELASPLWPPHHGDDRRGISEKVTKSLEQEVSSRVGMSTFHSFLVNGIMIHLVTKLAQWPPF